MSEKIINVQDAFLNYLRKNKIPVTIFLLNGVKLQGVIACFDTVSIVIKREGYTQLIYKHSISTFSPHGAISVFDWNNPVTASRPVEESSEEEKEEDSEFEYDEEDDEDYEYEDEDDEDDDDDINSKEKAH